MAIITPDNQEFKKVIQDLSNQSKLQTLETSLLVKYQREIAGEDGDKREKQLDAINETLKQILNALGPKGKTKGKGGKGVDNDSEISLRDELKYVFSGASKMGSNIKESVKGAYFTKPTSAAPMSSSAEALEAQDAINQPKQVEMDQLKIAEETNDTQKDILKELKKLNETTEQSAQAGGGGSSTPSIDIGSGPDGKGKPGGKKPGLGSRILSGAAKVARAAGPIGAVAGAAYGAYEGAGRAGEVFGVDQDKATLGQKAASAAGGILDPFGLGYGDKAAKGIYGFFGGGKEKASDTAPTGAPAASSSAPASKVGGAIAATTAPAAADKKSSSVSSAKSEENLEKLETAEGELQNIYKEYRDEKAKVSEKLMSDPKYSGGIVDDPSNPEYPSELKAIDDKYQKLIDAKKKEVEDLSKAPGISEAKANQAKESVDKLESEAPAKSKSTVTGESAKTTTETTVSGGGSETTKMVLSEDANKAKAESSSLQDSLAAEKKQVVDKLKAEGKISGKLPSSSDYENIPELKELKAKTDAEAAVLSKRVDQGTSYEVSKTSGENTAMRDEISSSKGTAQPIISNNNTSTSTNNFMPIKGDPRPNSRGSALDNHMNRVSAY